jgi:hypothetical protein
MTKLLFILVVFVATGAIGCAQLTGPAWHQRIAIVPTTQPRDAVDPETGEPLWRDFADREFPEPLSRDTAFQVLLNTETFADAYVGYAGTKSAQVDAFQVLLAQPDAKATFSDLLDRARTAGKLYALCAFYLIAPEEYATAERRVLASAGTVDQQMGCVTDGRPVREVVHCSDPNTVRLRRGETVKEWFARVKPPGDGAMYDISGGAIPETFRDAR